MKSINIFGLPAFKNCPPRNWAETQNRFVITHMHIYRHIHAYAYTFTYIHIFSLRLYFVSLHYRKLSMAFAFYDLSSAFNRTYARNLTLVALIDVGC